MARWAGDELVLTPAPENLDDGWHYVRGTETDQSPIDLFVEAHWSQSATAQPWRANGGKRGGDRHALRV